MEAFTNSGGTLLVTPPPVSPRGGDGWTWTLGCVPDQLSEPMALVWRFIPPGPGRLGARGYFDDEEPVHEVVVNRGFWLLETPVTQAQWLAVMGGKNPSYHQDFPKWREHPVEQVTWPLAKQFCRTLAGMMPAGLQAMWRPDLPTEAQWEYAARAGSLGEYGGGDGEEHLDRVGWYTGNSGGFTHPVRGKEPNAWNLYDMHGNVWEWCEDPWNAAAYQVRDEPWPADRVAPGDDESHRVCRGGGYAGLPALCRAAYRSRWRPGNDDGSQGLRACLWPGPR